MSQIVDLQKERDRRYFWERKREFYEEQIQKAWRDMQGWTELLNKHRKAEP